jgi:hypothetical protein
MLFGGRESAVACWPRLKPMRVHHFFAIAAISLFLASCASHPGFRPTATEASVNELLASPMPFDGTRVLVKGFFLMPMVGDMALYQDEPDYHHHRPERGIRLAVENQQKNLMPFQLKQCLVEGTFHAGHDTVASSYLNEITRFELAK